MTTTKIQAKKSLGQNWLKNERIVAKIVSAAQIAKKEWVLEVGPGQGILTHALLDAGAQVIAVEKDDRLIDELKQKFSLELMSDKPASPSQGGLELIHHDILNFDPILINHQYKVVANLPYYITGEFIKKFLTTPNQPSLMVLMLQKEVAERIGKNKKESVLSLSVKVYGEPKYIKTVPRGNFTPAPKVDSAILLIDKISKDFFIKNKIKEKDFFSLLKRGFGSKRKKLKNNLKLTGELLTKYGDQRAEDLQLNDWLKICASN